MFIVLYKQITCLNFTGEEFNNKRWRKIDALCKKRVLINGNGDKYYEEMKFSDCLLVKLGTKISAKMINSLPNLKYIGMLGTGFGGIDVRYAAKRGIVVTNIADYATEGVAEFTFGILLEQLRQISHAKQQAKMGNYDDNFLGTEIKGKKFGVIGLGHIGMRTAELAQAFGADVIYWSKNRKPKADAKGITYSTDVWSKADIITINLALNTATESYVNAARIADIKKGTVVISPSPMELFDFQALVTRLKQDDITFILDHSDEMTTDQLSQLKSLDNCIIYPPIGYLTKEASQLKKQIYTENLKNFLEGQPSNQVN